MAAKMNKNTLALVLIVVLVLVAAYQLKDLTGDFWPGRAMMKDGVETVERLQGEYQRVLNQRQQLDAHRDSFVKHAAGLWIQSRDGNANTEASRRLEGVAANAGLKLSTISRLQSSKVADGVKVMEITINATDSYDKVADFIAGLDKATPRFYWKTLNLRPESKNDNIRMYGTLQFLSVDDDDLKDAVLE